jgi:hypothetical protein
MALLREFSCGIFAGQEGPERGKLLETVSRERLMNALQAGDNLCLHQ